MEEIILNARRMTSIEQLHRYIKRKLDLPNYYGKNLDALWDVLSTISNPVCIKLINEDELYKNLGDYTEPFLRVFIEAANENENLYFEIGNKSE